MVVKLGGDAKGIIAAFESRVILDGSQTMLKLFPICDLFESRVILDGSQTLLNVKEEPDEFESRVILDGSQTWMKTTPANQGLRVVLF